MTSARKLTYQDIENALAKLPADQQKEINEQANRIEMRVHDQWYGRTNFGRMQALELLAKMGIWMIEEDL